MSAPKRSRSTGEKEQTRGKSGALKNGSAAAAPPDAAYFTDQFVPYLINHAASLFNLQFRKDLRKLDISVIQWRVLAVLHGAPGLALREIVEKTAIDQPTLSRVIDQLHERELIERSARESDSRYLSLSLTEEGEALYERLWQLAWKHYQRGASNLSAEETNMLVALLQKTISSLKGE
jgi:DNA-binding MarR family transcriptional regulator